MSTEWALVFFTLFGCLAVGMFVGIAALEWTGGAKEVCERGAKAVVVILALSVFSSVLHLGHPERIFGALGHPTSGIFTEALLIGLTGLDLIVYILAIRRKATDQARRSIVAVGLIPAVMLTFSVGYTYVMASRPAWNTLVLPLLYVSSAAVLGCFGLSALLVVNKITSGPELSRAALISIGAQAVLTISYLIHLAVAPYPEVTRSAGRVMVGDLAPLFWGGMVLLGWAVPLLTLLRGKLESPTTVRLTLLSVLIGGVAFRVLMFSLGSGVRNFF